MHYLFWVKLWVRCFLQYFKLFSLCNLCGLCTFAYCAPHLLAFKSISPHICTRIVFVNVAYFMKSKVFYSETLVSKEIKAANLQ